jgi:hypothetical protein
MKGSNFTGRPRPIMPLLYDLLAMANERFVIGIFMKRSTSQLVSIAVHCVTPLTTAIEKLFESSELVP